jgi:hypothetical protein
VEESKQERHQLHEKIEARIDMSKWTKSGWQLDRDKHRTQELISKPSDPPNPKRNQPGEDYGLEQNKARGPNTDLS